MRPPSRFQLALALAVCVAWSGGARAQSVSTILDPVVPVDFERGRNVSVKTIDPHFTPVGVRAGSFQIFPSISLASGATDNVYVNNDTKVSDALFTLRPQIQVLSEWSRHSVTLNANADLVRYAHQTLRNREEYSVAATGRLDVFSTMTVKANLNYDRRAESPYLDELSSLNATVLSQYSRFNPSLSFAYTAGHTRLTATAEHYGFRFNTVSLANGTVRDQRERNRDIERLALQADYAFTPSLAVYVQVNGDHTNYLSPRFDGTANRDGDTVRVIGGVALDMAGLLRGKIAAGYTKKDYTAARYDDVSGLTVDSSLELFVSPLTTVTLAGRSSLQDINNNVNNGAFRDVTLSAGVDHALLRNLLLSAKATHIRRSPVESSDRLGQSIVQLNFEGAYQADRYTILSLRLGYGHGRPTNGSGSVSFDELSGQASIQLRL